MATTDLKMADYNALFTADGLNTNVIAELDLAIHAQRAVVQDDFAQQGDTFVPDASGDLPQVVLVDGSVTGTDTINTSLDTSLKAIVDQHGDNLTVNGTQNVFVTADDTPGASITLNDSGNDVVQAGNGGDSIDASASTGRDTLLGGTGNDFLHLGSGAGSVALSSTGSIEVTGGDHQLLAAMGGVENNSGGYAHEVLYDGAGGTESDTNGLDDLLAGNASLARLFGSTTGDTEIGAANVVDASTGANTLIAGNATTVFNIGTTANDTIIGNSTSQVVTSQDATSTDVVSQVLNSHTGVTTMTLADGQVLKLANITTVNFADGSSVAVDPPAQVNSYVADVVGAAEAHAAQAEAHVAAINAHWGHA